MSLAVVLGFADDARFSDINMTVHYVKSADETASISYSLKCEPSPHPRPEEPRRDRVAPRGWVRSRRRLTLQPTHKQLGKKLTGTQEFYNN